MENKLIITGEDINVEKCSFDFNRKDSERYGCDYCKKVKATERFEGYKGGVLWICGECYKELTQKTGESK